MRTDVNAYLGAYPFHDSAPWDADQLLAEMRHAGVTEAWVSHLAAVFWRDPAAGNRTLYDVSQRIPQLRPVPAVHPGMPGWEAELDAARAAGAPCVRADPTWYGIEPAGSAMRELVRRCAAAGMPLRLTVRFEDGRQRHPLDTAAELPPWAIRALLRSDPGIRLVVAAADRECIEQVHFGSTPDESARLLWDISWIWGPPEDHLELLLRTVGTAAFAFGTGLPLRLAENAVAKLDLLELEAADRDAINRENAARCAAGPG